MCVHGIMEVYVQGVAYPAAWAADLLLVFGLVLHSAPHPSGALPVS